MARFTYKYHSGRLEAKQKGEELGEFLQVYGHKASPRKRQEASVVNRFIFRSKWQKTKMEMSKCRVKKQICEAFQLESLVLNLHLEMTAE